MAHELELTGDGVASFAYSKNYGDPWHRLGTPLDGLSDVDTILQLSRADYEVHKATLLTPDPAPSRRDGIGRPMLDTGSSYTWRTRPIWIGDDGQPRGGDRHVLGIVGNDYPVVQNRQLTELALRLVGALPGDRTIDCAGVLDDGRRFFLTIPLDDIVLDPSGVADVHGRNLVVSTGHDGHWAINFVHGIVRAVCANTVQAANDSAHWLVTIPHRGKFDPDRISLQRALGLAERGGSVFEETAVKLLGMPASFDVVVSTHDRIWGAARAKSIRVNRLNTLETLWTSDTNVGAVGANRWAALMTFSEYFEHRQQFAGSKRPGARPLRATGVGGMHTRITQARKILETI
jgi:phage/plasmid-like protein (TIGR03299 family)